MSRDDLAAFWLDFRTSKALKIRLQSGHQKEVKTKSQQVTHQQQQDKFRLIRGGGAGYGFYQDGSLATSTKVARVLPYAWQSISPPLRPDLDLDRRIWFYRPHCCKETWIFPPETLREELLVRMRAGFGRGSDWMMAVRQVAMSSGGSRTLDWVIGRFWTSSSLGSRLSSLPKRHQHGTHSFVNRERDDTHDTLARGGCSPGGEHQCRLGLPCKSEYIGF